MERACENCTYWKKDYGIYTVTGWTGMDRKNGGCHFEPKAVSTQADDFCSHFEERV